MSSPNEFKTKEEKIEIVTPEIIETPDTSYWLGQQQLDYNVALRNKPTTFSSFFLWRSLHSSWTWDQAITGVWFKPRMVKITTYKLGSGGVFCTGTAQGTSQYSVCTYYNGSYFTADDTKVIYCHEWTTYSIASLSSFDNDWFTLNWSYGYLSVIFFYECYA